MKELTIGDLIDELEEYPRDTPVWPQLHIRGIFMMLDLEFSKYHSLDAGDSHQLHLVFKQSDIYEVSRERRENRKPCSVEEKYPLHPEGKTGGRRY